MGNFVKPILKRNETQCKSVVLRDKGTTKRGKSCENNQWQLTMLLNAAKVVAFHIMWSILCCYCRCCLVRYYCCQNLFCFTFSLLEIVYLLPAIITQQLQTEWIEKKNVYAFATHFFSLSRPTTHTHSDRLKTHL